MEGRESLAGGREAEIWASFAAAAAELCQGLWLVVVVIVFRVPVDG